MRWVHWGLIPIALAAFVVGSAFAGASHLELAWLRGGSAEYFRLTSTEGAANGYRGASLPAEKRTPLGSLWKLFVYAYLADAGREIPPLTCQGKSPAEAYCCRPGERIGPEDALATSCGLFFEPARLGLTQEAWGAYWRQALSGRPHWLTDLSQLRPETTVSVASILEGLAAIPSSAHLQTEHALVRTLFAGRLESPVRYFGGMLHVKTWTWDHPTQPGKRIGGFAGWLADGTPIWAGGEGPSGPLLSRWAPTIASWLASLPGSSRDDGCVLVEMFDRYPIRRVIDLDRSQPAGTGPLHGQYRVDFQQGTNLQIRSRGELTLGPGPDPRITGKFGLNEYVARVLDREAGPEPREAARALAIVIRSYAIQEATRAGSCYRIPDSSHTQRVSPNPASHAARQIAGWTDGLMLTGEPVGYHRSKDGTQLLAWNRAAAQAQAGLAFDEILAVAFPKAVLASLYAPDATDCLRLPEVERWVRAQLPRWQRVLAGTAGFDPPEGILACRLQVGRPHADVGRRRIYVTGLRSQDDRVTVTHESLHVAFQWHPRGADEEFIERTARRLAEE